MKKIYTCPMHPEVRQDHPGKCPKCGMNLVEEGSKKIDSNNSYAPLLIIVSLIALVAFLTGNFIENFMIGFFLVFSGFKLIDLKGFAEAYSTYDLLAKRFYYYGYIYPFIELFFAIAMIVKFEMQLVLILEIIVMTFSGIGVLIKLLKREKFQCACLGTVLKVPLTYVTLIEDFGMALLALLLLIR